MSYLLANEEEGAFFDRPTGFHALRRPTCETSIMPFKTFQARAAAAHGMDPDAPELIVAFYQIPPGASRTRYEEALKAAAADSRARQSRRAVIKRDREAPRMWRGGVDLPSTLDSKQENTFTA